MEGEILVGGHLVAWPMEEESQEAARREAEDPLVARRAPEGA